LAKLVNTEKDGFDLIFNSPIFILFFLPVFLSLFFLSGIKYKNYVILAGSMVFYAWGEPRFIFIVLISSTIDWFLGNIIYKSTVSRIRIWAVVLSVSLNIAILFFFKYINFTLDNINSVLNFVNINPLIFAKVALPIGVSFVVFEKITYIIDIYRGKDKPADQFISYLLYIFLFPKLLAGPIVKYHDIKDQLNKRLVRKDDIIYGLTRFSFGMAKKVFIADTVGELANQCFALSPSELGFANAWMGAICYTLQIYFDFSAYSDMAIGLGRVMGFRIMENFNLPYISKSFTEFWRRWHISLSTWIKEYLYISLGGNRGSKARTYFNLWICFLISGLWHGASWTFILWGIYHGSFLILEKLFLLEYKKKLPDLLNWATNIFFLIIGWVIFRATSIHHVKQYLQAMFNPFFWTGKYLYLSDNQLFFGLLGIVICIFPLLKKHNLNHIEEISKPNSEFKYKVLLGTVLLLLSLAKVSASSYNPFLYFRF